MLCGSFAECLPDIRRLIAWSSSVPEPWGRFEDQFDIDLALWGDVDRSLVGRIARELDELPLPCTFDVKAYQTIRREPRRNHIDEVGKILYQTQSPQQPTT